MTTIRAIETRYNGYRFRSRLEARWAVFFDALGVPWEYEREGFELPSGRYLPDFWLPTWDVYGEVKPSPNDYTETHDELVFATQKTLICLVGTPEIAWYAVRTFAWWEPEKPAVVDDWIDLGMSAAKERVWHSFGDRPTGPLFSTGAFHHAVHAARAARFEFGEVPRVGAYR